MAYADRPYYGQQQTRGFGGLVTPGGRSVATWLIIINVGVFFLDGFTGRIGHGPSAIGDTLFQKWGAFSFLDGVQHLQIWRFITFQFLHGGGWHLFGNMLALFFFAPLVERYLGSRRFLAYYLLCGVAGAVLYVILLGIGQFPSAERIPFVISGSTATPMVGASAGVFGTLFGAYRIAPNSNVLLFFVIPVPLRVLILIILLIEVYALMVGGSNSGGSAAHLGGVLLGAILMARPAWLNWADRPGRHLKHFSPQEIKAKSKRRTYERRVRSSRRREQEIDRILEKVNRHGLQSLTRKEKRVLKNETERQRHG